MTTTQTSPAIAAPTARRAAMTVALGAVVACVAMSSTSGIIAAQGQPDATALAPYEFASELPSVAELPALATTTGPTDVPRLTLALMRLIRPAADLSAVRATLDSHSRRLQRYVQPRLAGRSVADLREFIAAYPERGVNLRRYESGPLRLPTEVLADRGGAPIELALTVALLANLAGLRTTLMHDGADVAAERMWATAIEWPDGWRSIVAVGGGAERCTTPGDFRAVAVALLDRRIRDVAAETESVGLTGPPLIAALRHEWQMLDVLTAAETGLAPSVARFSRMVQVLDALADAHAQADDEAEAQTFRALADAALAQAAKLGDDPELTYTLAERSYKNGDFPRAEALYLRLPSDWNPDKGPHPVVRRAEILLRRQADRDALELIASARQRSLGSAELWAAGAAVAFSLDEWVLCLDLYDAAERAGFVGATIYLHRGYIRYHEARRTADRAAAVAAYAQSLANFRAAVAHDATSSSAHLELVRALVNPPIDVSPRPAEALAALEAARNVVSEPAVFWKLDAMIRLDWLDDRDGARRALETYTEMAPADATAREWLAELKGER